MTREEELGHLHADALARELIEAGAAGDTGGEALRIGRTRAVGGMEAEEPQDPQIILGDAGCRIADETHAPRFDIGEPTHIIVDGAVARDGERIDREIAALGVTSPVAPEGHFGMSPECFHIFAERGDLERPAGGNDGDGAMLDTSRHGLEAGLLNTAHDFLWKRRRGDIDVAVRFAEQRVAHGTADDASLLAARVEHCEQSGKRRLLQPFGLEVPRHVGHLVSPGTNWPSSIRAGLYVEPGGAPPHSASTMKLPIISANAAIRSQPSRPRDQFTRSSTPPRVSQRNKA